MPRPNGKASSLRSVAKDTAAAAALGLVPELALPLEIAARATGTGGAPPTPERPVAILGAPSRTVTRRTRTGSVTTHYPPRGVTGAELAALAGVAAVAYAARAAAQAASSLAASKPWWLP